MGGREGETGESSELMDHFLQSEFLWTKPSYLEWNPSRETERKAPLSELLEDNTVGEALSADTDAFQDTITS